MRKYQKTAKIIGRGFPKQAGGQDSTLLLQGVWVQFAVRKLRSCRPHGTAKKKKNTVNIKKKKKKTGKI